MKIGLFTDSHYSSSPVTCGNRLNNQSLRKIEEAMNAFVKERCDLVIILGDVTDTEPTREQEKQNLRQIAQVLDDSGLKVYGLIGEAYRPRLVRAEGVNLIFLDACYFHTGVHYAPGDTDWTDAFYPHTAELQNALSQLMGDTYVFMHQNVDPEVRKDHCLCNAEQVRLLLETAGNVKAVYQGHYHAGHECCCNGIAYITLPAMCQNEGAYRVIQFPESM